MQKYKLDDQSTMELLPKQKENKETRRPTPSTVSQDKEKLYKALIDGDEDLFRQILEKMERHHGENLAVELSSPIRKDTLLNCAILCGKNGHLWAVTLLIEKGVDPNQTTTEVTKPAIMQAAKIGNVEIFEILAKHENIKLDLVDKKNVNQTVLHEIALKLNNAISKEEKSGYVECLEILVSKIETLDPANCPWIDNQDILGNTALHYAAVSGVEDAVIKLLRIGSKLGIQNQLGETAIKRIKPSTLEFSLDSCIKIGKEKDFSSNKFEIVFDYSLLAPPRPQTQSTQPQNSSNGKRRRTTDYKIYPECETLWHLSRSTDHQYLLKHPLITSFLMLKWRLIRKFYCINLVVYILTTLFLTAYILLLHSGCEPQSTWIPAIILRVFSALFVTIILIREVFQLCIAPMRYFFTVENYIELAMIGCTITVLAHSGDPDPIRNTSAFAVLLGWAEGFLLLGRHPKLSIYIKMFSAVSFTFLKLLLWYSVLLIGFALSFFLVLGGAINPASNKPENSTTSSECHWNETTIYHFPVTLLNVVVMMTGEFEYGNLAFEAFPVSSRIIFLSFLFLIAIVLLNLLNGLAVSDTQDIRNKAEILGCVSQVGLISYLESIFLGDPFHFLVDWPPFAFIRNRCRSCTMLPVFMWCNLLNSFASKAVLVNHYSSISTNMTFKVRTRRISDGGLEKPLSNFKLNKKILENACQRIRERYNQQNQQENFEKILNEVEKLRTDLKKNCNQQTLEKILDEVGQLRTAFISLQKEHS